MISPDKQDREIRLSDVDGTPVKTEVRSKQFAYGEHVVYAHTAQDRRKLKIRGFTDWPEDRPLLLGVPEELEGEPNLVEAAKSLWSIMGENDQSDFIEHLKAERDKSPAPPEFVTNAKSVTLKAVYKSLTNSNGTGMNKADLWESIVAFKPELADEDVFNAYVEEVG
jgi:hypothetical protein